MKLKRIIAFVLLICMPTSYAFADDVGSSSLLDSLGGWLNNAWNDSSKWAEQTWNDSSAWVVKTWDDNAAWVSQAWMDSMDWVSHTWTDSSAWLSTAWFDSASWVGSAWTGLSDSVVQTWDNSANWAASTWQNFVSWVSVLTMENPYSWIEHVVLENGQLAYDRFAAVRAFLSSNPDMEQLKKFYDERFSELSLLAEDKAIIWNILEKWSDENGLSIVQTARIALPFLERLLIEGGAAIGEDVVFSGPIVAQYLITVLEVINLDSNEKAEASLNALYTTVKSLTRPVIIGDTD